MPEYTREQVLGWLERLAAGRLELNEDNMGLADAALDLLGEFEQAVPTLPPGYLTPHFTLAELVRSDTATAKGILNLPDAMEVANLTRLAEVLEEIRSLCGDNPVLISSAFRSEELNRAVGGVPNSAHRKGLAADFTIPAFGTPTQVCQHLVGRVRSLGIDQLINEKTGGSEWVHVGLSEDEPRNQALTITDGGTVSGIV
jgi:hypothetical protein